MANRNVGNTFHGERLVGGGSTSFVVYEHYATVYKGKKGKKVQYRGPVKQSRGKPPVPHGLGTMTYTNGFTLRGPFKDGRRHGPFTVIDTDGDQSKVCFLDDTYRKKACSKRINAPANKGTKQTIVYVKQKRNRLYFHGQLKARVPHGKGTMYYTNRDAQTGQWLHGTFQSTASSSSNATCSQCTQCLMDYGGMSHEQAEHAIDEITGITRILAQKAPNKRRLNALYESLLDRLPILEGSNPNDFGINAGDYSLGNQTITIPDLNKVKPLGEGSFGIVYRGYTQRPGESPTPIAIKLPKVNLCDEYKAAACRKEEGCRWSLDKSTKRKRRAHAPKKDDYVPRAMNDVEWEPDDGNVDVDLLRNEATMDLDALRKKLAQFQGGGTRGKCVQESFKYATSDEMKTLQQAQYGFVVESLVHLLLACVQSKDDVLSMVAPRPIFIAKVEPRYLTRDMTQQLDQNFGIQRRTIIVGMEALDYDGEAALKKGVVDVFNMLVQSAYLLSLCNRHGIRFVHRDFHPGNIMCVVHKTPQRIRIPVGDEKYINYSTRVVWKIIDFGMSCIYTDCCNENRHGWLIASQEETPYSDKPMVHCKNKAMDMRIMMFYLYDVHYNKFKRSMPWIREFLDFFFGDDAPEFTDEGWWDAYEEDKFSRKDKKRYAPEHVLRELYDYLKENPFRSVHVK